MLSVQTNPDEFWTCVNSLHLAHNLGLQPNSRMAEKRECILKFLSMTSTAPDYYQEWKLISMEPVGDNTNVRCVCSQTHLNDLYYYINIHTEVVICLGSVCAGHVENGFVAGDDESDDDEPNDEPDETEYAAIKIIARRGIGSTLEYLVEWTPSWQRTPNPLIGDVREILAHRHGHYLIDWEPTWEPARNVTPALRQAFEQPQVW